MEAPLCTEKYPILWWIINILYMSLRKFSYFVFTVKVNCRYFSLSVAVTALSVSCYVLFCCVPGFSFCGDSFLHIIERISINKVSFQ